LRNILFKVNNMNNMQGKGCTTNATNTAGGNNASMGKSAGGSNISSMGRNNTNSPMSATPMGEARAKNNACSTKPSGGGCSTGGCKPTK
jgi:hypothetical protein